MGLYALHASLGGQGKCKVAHLAIGVFIEVRNPKASAEAIARRIGNFTTSGMKLSESLKKSNVTGDTLRRHLPA